MKPHLDCTEDWAHLFVINSLIVSHTRALGAESALLPGSL